MTKEEMLKMAVDQLEKSPSIKEVELQGAVADSNKDFRVRVVRTDPYYWGNWTYTYPNGTMVTGNGPFQLPLKD